MTESNASPTPDNPADGALIAYLDEAAAPAQFEAAPGKTRKRIAPYIRIALQMHDGRWEFFESLRSMKGVPAKAGLILSGASRQDVIDAVTALIPRIVLVYPAPGDAFLGVHFYSAPEPA